MHTRAHHHPPDDRAGSPSVKSAEKRGPALMKQQQIPGPSALFSARKTLKIVGTVSHYEENGAASAPKI